MKRCDGWQESEKRKRQFKIMSHLGAVKTFHLLCEMKMFTVDAGLRVRVKSETKLMKVAGNDENFFLWWHDEWGEDEMVY